MLASALTGSHVMEPERKCEDVLVSAPRLEEQRPRNSGVMFSPGSQYIMSNQAFKDKKEESKARRSGIMKSLKDLLLEDSDQDHLKLIVQPDGTKRLVVELSDLHSVMEDFSALQFKR
jgi:hypothetical protein